MPFYILQNMIVRRPNVKKQYNFVTLFEIGLHFVSNQKLHFEPWTLGLYYTLI